MEYFVHLTGSAITKEVERVSARRQDIRPGFIGLSQSRRPIREHFQSNEVPVQVAKHAAQSSFFALHAIECRIAHEQPSNKETSSRSKRRPAKQTKPFNAAKARSFWRAKMVLAICWLGHFVLV
jgi:hypothetical protein